MTAAASALPKERFALLFAVMLVAASGNTAMQSLMPSIGRELGVADLWVAIAFSLSAVIWVVTAPYWARRADHRGRRALMRLGLYGFIVSMLVCGGVLAAGLRGLLAPLTVFLIFVLGRAVYGAWGSASPPAVQAYVAARTSGERRTAGNGLFRAEDNLESPWARRALIGFYNNLVWGTATAMPLDEFMEKT
ncbi:MAG: MFS transporter, partial [Allosphingosinicella sp.]